jgi:hypothetical protein
MRDYRGFLKHHVNIPYSRARHETAQRHESEQFAGVRHECVPRETWSEIKAVKWVGLVLALLRGIFLACEKIWLANGKDRAGAGRRLPVCVACFLRLQQGEEDSDLCMMASQLFRDVARFLTPAPPVLSSEYDGLEYTWKIFIFRPARE